MTKPLKRLTTDRTTSNSSMQQVFAGWDGKGVWRGTDYWAKQQQKGQQQTSQKKPSNSVSSTNKQQYSSNNPLEPQHKNPQYDLQNSQQYEEQIYKDIDNDKQNDLQQYEDSQYTAFDEEPQYNPIYEDQYEEDNYKQGIEDQNYLTQYNDINNNQYEDSQYTAFDEEPDYNVDESQQYNETNYGDVDEIDNSQYEEQHYYDDYNNDNNYDSQYNVHEEPADLTPQYNDYDEEQDDSLISPQYNNYVDEDTGFYKNNQQFDEDGNLIQNNDLSQYDYQYNSHSTNPNIANNELSQNLEKQISDLQSNLSAQYNDDEESGYYKNNKQFDADNNEVLQNEINNTMQQYQEQQQISTELDKDIEEEAQTLTKEQQDIKDDLDNIIKQYEDNTPSQYSVIDKINNSKYSLNDFNEEEDEISNILNSDQYSNEPVVQDNIQYKELGNDYSQDYNQYETPETDNLTNENNINSTDLLQYNKPVEYSETFKPYSGMNKREPFDITCVCKDTKKLKKQELNAKAAIYSILGIIVFIIIFCLCLFWYKNKLMCQLNKQSVTIVKPPPVLNEFLIRDPRNNDKNKDDEEII